MSNKFISAVVKDAEAVKNFILKVAGEAPGVLQKVTNDAALLTPVIEAFVPKSTTAINTALSIADQVAEAVEAAGPAATANGLSVSFDQSVVADVQAVIAAAKAAAAQVK